MSDGTLSCWDNDELVPPAGTFKSVSMGLSGACAIGADDSIKCFASDGSIDQVPSGAFSSVSVGSGYACAIRSDDALICWGTDPMGFGTVTPPY